MPVHPRECIGPMFIYNAWPILEGQCRTDGHNFIEPIFAADVGPMDRPTSSQRWVKSGPIFYASWAQLAQVKLGQRRHTLDWVPYFGPT